MSPKNSSSAAEIEVILKNRFRAKRSSRGRCSEPQKWIRTPSDSNGWFRLFHIESEKYLTSSCPDKVCLENLHSSEKSKKILVPVNKTYCFCPHVEALVNFIAIERGFEDGE